MPQFPQQTLQHPEAGPTPTTERYPVSYAPRSTTRINTERLPPPEQLSGMSLCYREEPESEEALCRSVQLELILFALLSSLAAFLIHFIGPVIPFRLAFPAALLVSVALVLALIRFPARRSLKAILKGFFLPPVAVSAAFLLSQLLASRPLAAFALGGVSLLLCCLPAGELHPLRFYREWLFAAPHLKPETRARRRSVWTRDALSLLTCSGSALATLLVTLAMSAAILFLIVIGAAWSPELATLALLLLGLVMTDFNPWGTWRLARRVLARSLTYGRHLSGAPGVWRPETTLRERRRTAASAVFLFHLALSTGLCLYLPADLVAAGARGPGQSDETLSHALGERLSPAQARATLFAADRGLPAGIAELLAARHADTHEGLRSIRDGVRRAWRLSAGGFLSFFVLPFALALVLPNLTLLALLRPLLLRAETLRSRIEGGPEDPLSAAGRSLLTALRNLPRRLRGLEPLEAESRDVPGLDDDGRTEWQWYVDRLRGSRHEATDPFGSPVREADHLFLGVEPVRQFPVLLDRRILSEHCYVNGQTGSGKTSLGLMPLLIQLIRGNLTADGTPAPPAPIVIIDLKGDPALFHTARLEARARGQRFLFFTPEKGKTSYHFNPFSGFQSPSRTFIQLCQLFLDSLSLNHGEGYGRSYYSRRSRQALFDALNHPSAPQTFPELFEVLTEMSAREEYRDSYEVLSTIHALAQYPTLVTTSAQDRAAAGTTINMQTVIEESQVVYFWLPSAIESITSREIGKLALFTLLSAAIDRQLEGRGTKQAWLFIDEFQRLAGENFRIVLEQARSFGLSAILSNQTLSDLKNRDFDLRPTILTNTRVRMHFSLNDPAEIETLSRLSGEEVRLQRQWTRSEELSRRLFRNRTVSETAVEGFKNRLTTSDILAASDHPLEMILCVSRGSGCTQFGGLPVRVRTAWPVSAEEDRRRAGLPWPGPEEFPPQEVTENLQSPRELETAARQEVYRRKQEILQRVLGPSGPEHGKGA